MYKPASRKSRDTNDYLVRYLYYMTPWHCLFWYGRVATSCPARTAQNHLQNISNNLALIFAKVKIINLNDITAMSTKRQCQPNARYAQGPSSLTCSLPGDIRSAKLANTDNIIGSWRRRGRRRESNLFQETKARRRTMHRYPRGDHNRGMRLRGVDLGSNRHA